MANLVGLYITHVDDSLQGRQGPSIRFWGIPQDRHRFRILIELFIETIRNSLDTRPPPLDIKELDSNQTYCVLINNQWFRARIPDVKLGLYETLRVFCIDTGSYHIIPLTFLRTLNFPGNEEENLRNWAPLANMFLLADIVAPLYGVGRLWSESSMMFLKMHVEKHFCKGILIGDHGKYWFVRLFSSNNQLLATIMIERNMGVSVQTYHEYMEVYSSIICRMMDNFHAHVLAPPDTSNVKGDVPKLLISKANADKGFNQLKSIIRKSIPKCIVKIPVADLIGEQDLYVTVAEKPGIFFGQLKSVVQDLDKLTNELHKVYSSLSFPTLLYADVKSHLWEYGVLKWDEVQMYYRVRITKELVNDAEVLFIDYGNSIRISRSKILAPLDCLTIFHQPPFGIHCQVENDVTMSIPEWRNLIAEKFTKVKIGRCADGIYSVTFTNDPCNDEIARILSPVASSEMNDVESGKVLPNSLPSQEIKARKDSVPQASVPSSIRLPLNDDRLLKNHENSITVTVLWGSRSDAGRLEEVALPEISETSASSNQHQIIYPEQPEVLSDQRVEVVSVNDCASFYVRLLESCDLLGDLEGKINAVYSGESKPTIQNPKPGSACVVQYQEDSGWYRGKIVKIYDLQVASVLFVDYGNIQSGPIEQIKAIEEEFLNLPPLAYHCKLIGVDASRDWTFEEKSKFKSRTIGKILSATFTIRNSEGQYPVQLVGETKEAKRVINDDFGAPGFANIPPPSAGYTSRSVSDKPISVIVNFFVNPLRFFLSPIDVENKNQLEELENFYSSLSPTDLLENQPSLGLPCVARFTEDGRFYRSQILSIRDEMADILFVDYGNQQETPLSQLKRITPRFMEFPQMTWCCKLKEVKMTSPISAELHKHIEACFATNEELLASLHPTSSDGSNGIFEVDLTIPKIGDASRYLIEQNVLERDSMETDVELAAQDLNFAPQQIISNNAVTLCFKSSTDFCVQLEPKTVEDIMERLDKLSLDPGFIKKRDFVPSIGKPCLAFYEKDKRWYRAIIEAVKQDCATICYVDYGDSSDVKTSNLRGLPKEFAQIPALAFKCCQDGAESFSETASEVFKEIVLDLTNCSVKFLKVVGGVLCVRLSHGESDVGELCNSVLVKSSLEEAAVPSTINLTDSEVSGTLLPITEYTSLPVSEAPIEVCVSWYDNPCRFFLSPIHLSQYQNQLEELEIFYSSLSPKELIEDQAIVGLPCVARFTEDDRYYRSEILSIRELMAELLFVDFGNKQNTPLSQLKRMVPRFMEFPKLAWNCKLEGVKKMATYPFNTNPQQFLTSCFLTGQALSAVFHSSVSVGNKVVFEVNLAVPKIGDVSEYLIRHKILERISNVELPPQNANFVSNQIISTRAVVSYIKSPTEFWVHLDPESVDLVTARIDELVLDPGFSNKNNFTAAKGKLCLSLFPDDKHWYRATVEVVNGDTAKVYFFDYGNNCTVKISDLRELPVELSKQPALAFKCSLDGSKSFSKDATASFETLMLGIPVFTVKCMDVSNGVLIVRLYSSSGINLVKQLGSGKLTLTSIQEEEPAECIPEIPSTEWKGQITYSSSPNTFWFQLQRNNAEMDEMEIQLNQLCQKYSIDSSCVKDEPNSNQIYGIKHPKYSTWHRAKVHKVFDNTADVYFLDYGDSQVVPFANIIALPNQFQLIPPFAIRCRLKTIWKPVEFTSVLLEKLNAVCLEPGTSCNVVCKRRENDRLSFIESFFVADQNIIELLVANEKSEQSITLVQYINHMGEKSWMGDDGLKKPSTIQYLDLI